jgi:hypothetical protein
MTKMIINSIAVLLSALLIKDAVAQQQTYRITPGGEYQYIEQDATAFDETSGAYYKDITMRTFYLETHRMGLIPDSVRFEDFRAMTTEEQQAILKQSGSQLDCSSNNITLACLVFNPPTVYRSESAPVYRSDQARVMDLSKKCRRTRYGRNSLTESGKMVVEPDELPDCNEESAIDY